MLILKFQRNRHGKFDQNFVVRSRQLLVWVGAHLSWSLTGWRRRRSRWTRCSWTSVRSRNTAYSRADPQPTDRSSRLYICSTQQTHRPRLRLDHMYQEDGSVSHLTRIHGSNEMTDVTWTSWEHSRGCSGIFTCIGALGTPSRTGPLARKYLPGFP